MRNGMICGNSWGSHDKGWTWCTCERGHTGPCHNWATGDKPDDAKFYHEQPEAQAFIDRQRERQAKEDARK